MTVAIVGFSLAAALVGLLVYVLVLYSRERAEERSLRAKLLEELLNGQNLKMTLQKFEQSNAQLNEALAHKTVELSHEVDARKRLERYRDELLEEMARYGDPRGIATRIRAELQALSKMSARAAAAGKSGEGASGVSGTATGDPTSTVPGKSK